MQAISTPPKMKATPPGAPIAASAPTLNIEHKPVATDTPTIVAIYADGLQTTLLMARPNSPKELLKPPAHFLKKLLMGELALGLKDADIKHSN